MKHFGTINKILLLMIVSVVLFTSTAVANGNLVLVGGSLKGDNHDVYGKIVELARQSDLENGGTGEAIIGIFTASSGNAYSASDNGRYYVERFLQHGADEAHWIPIFYNPEYGNWDMFPDRDIDEEMERYYRNQASQPEVLQTINRATGFFFGGGDQSRYIRCLYDNDHQPFPALQAVKEKFDNEGVVISGTSAGCAIQSGGYDDLIPEINWEIHQYREPVAGLPGEDVNVITIDNDGNKWFGTQTGLAKFDGTNWEVYKTENSELTDNTVYDIAIDPNTGDLWIGTYYGLSHFDGTSWENFDTSNSGLPHDRINAVTVDSDGIVWCGTDAGLAKYDGATWQVYDTNNSDIPDNIVLTITLQETESDKWIWLGTYTEGGGVGKLNAADDTWETYTMDNSGLSDWEVYSIAIEGDIVWIGNYYTGIDRFDTVNDTWQNYDPGSWVFSVAIDDDGYKWIGTNKVGLVRIKDVESGNPVEETFFDTDNSELPSNSVHHILIDEEDNKWLGTKAGGAARFNEMDPDDANDDIWTIYQPSLPPTLPDPDNTVTAIGIEEAPSGNIYAWIGTPSGLAEFNGDSWDVYKSSETDEYSLSHDTVNAVTVDDAGLVWVGTPAGLDRFDGEYFDNYDPGAAVTTIALEADSIKWIGTDGNGVVSGTDVTIDGEFTGETFYNTTNSDLPSDTINVVYVDVDHNKWIGTDAGLAKFDGMNWEVHQTDRNVTAIARDIHGNVWLGTDAGLMKYDGNEWTEIVRVPEAVTSITADNLGNVWVGTNEIGMLRYDGEEWTSYNSENSNLTSDYINVLVSDPRGGKWIGTTGGGLIKLLEDKTDGDRNMIPIIAGGESYRALTHGSFPYYVDFVDELSYNPEGGFGFFPYGITDSHFSNRSRQARLIRLGWETGIDMLYGVDENTGMVVYNVNEPDVEIEVLGERGVSIFDLSQAYANPTPEWSIFNVKATYLTHEDRFKPLTKEVTYADWKSLYEGGGEAFTSDDIFESKYNPHPDYHSTFFPEFIFVSQELFASDAQSVVNYTYEDEPLYAVKFTKDRYYGSKGYMGWSPYDGYDYYSYENLILDIYPAETSDGNGERAPRHRISQNYPNPFNPVTTIDYFMPRSGDVDLMVYDMMGRRVKTLVDGNQDEGIYRVKWNGVDERGRKLPSGVYLYRLNIDGEEISTKRMILLK